MKKICVAILIWAGLSMLSVNYAQSVQNRTGMNMTIAVTDTFALVINEVLADNETILSDESGAFDDWIEIYNMGEQGINMSGYYLTNDMNDLMKWQLQSGEDSLLTTIGPGGFLLIWADDDTAEGVLHAGFELDQSGDTLALVYRDGETVIDSIIFEAQQTDISYGRAVDGGKRWRTFVEPSPGMPNTSEPVLLPPTDLYVHPNPLGARVSWDYWRPEKRVSYNNGVPGGIWQLPLNAGMGVVFDLSAYPSATLKQVDFLHYSNLMFSGNSRFMVRVYDMQEEVEIGRTDTLYADDAYDYPRFELGVNLPDTIRYASSVGVFIHPFSETEGSSAAFPSVMTDTSVLVPQTSFVTLNFDDFFNNLYGVEMFSPSATNAVIDLWINTSENERILVKHSSFTRKQFGNTGTPPEQIRTDTYEGYFEKLDHEKMLAVLDSSSAFNLYRGPDGGHLDLLVRLTNDQRTYLDQGAPPDSGYIYAVTTLVDSFESEADTFEYVHPALYTISEVRTDTDGDFVPDRLGDIVAVQGNINSVNFRGSEGSDYYLQDQEGGMNLKSEVVFGFGPGDAIYLAGRVQQRYGLAYIEPIDSNYVHLLTQENENDTLFAELGELGEEVEGRLIHVKGLEVLNPEQWPAEGNSAVLIVSDGLDTSSVLIDKDTDLDGWDPGSDILDITGIVSQSTLADPPDDAYLLIPRFRTDVAEGEQDTTGIADGGEELPLQYALGQNYPNPFNPVTTITYTVGVPGNVNVGTQDPASLQKPVYNVTLTIHNLLGQKIATLVSERQAAGRYAVRWNAHNLPSGIYFYRLQIGNDFTQTRKMAVIR